MKNPKERKKEVDRILAELNYEVDVVYDEWRARAVTQKAVELDKAYNTLCYLLEEFYRWEA